MMSKSQAQLSKQPYPTKPSNAANAYRPSVPISVYRELAGELQAAEAQLNSLKADNQKLLQQNQRLRQEVTKLFLSAQQVQQIVTTYDEYGKPLGTPTPTGADNNVDKSFSPAVDRPQPFPPSVPPLSDRKLVAEVEEKPSRRPSQGEVSSEVSGWLLGISVGLIVLTALGLGFLAMRFVMSSNQS